MAAPADAYGLRQAQKKAGRGASNLLPAGRIVRPARISAAQGHAFGGALAATGTIGAGALYLRHRRNQGIAKSYREGFLARRFDVLVGR